MLQVPAHPLSYLCADNIAVAEECDVEADMLASLRMLAPDDGR